MAIVSFRVQVFDLLTSPLVWQGQVPVDGGMPQGQAEENSISESKDCSEKKVGTILQLGVTGDLI